MSGDTDESGWQYSLNFGRGPFKTATAMAIKGITKPLPRSGNQGPEQMNERLEEKMEKRDLKEQTRDDHGLEALKRSARVRLPKWRGEPDPWTFVRRRRWIRMRRRKPLATAHKPKHASGTSTPTGNPSNASISAKGKGKKATSSSHLPNGRDSDSMHESDDDTDSSAISHSDESDGELAPADANASAFLPRALPGVFKNGSAQDQSAALQLKEGSELERRKKHAREFTGTVRELKSLLPAILDRKHYGRDLKDPSHRLEVAEWWRAELDARNPFISWKFVSRRLKDPDLAPASSSLRARETRFLQRQNGHQKMPSSFRQDSDQPQTSSNRRFSSTSFKSSNEAQHEDRSLTRDALVELNFRRVLRVMKACKVDRQKIELWRLWLGAESVESITKEEPWGGRGGWADELSPKDSASRKAAQASRTKWKGTFIQPDPLDVWDVLEGRVSAGFVFDFLFTKC